MNASMVMLKTFKGLEYLTTVSSGRFQVVKVEKWETISMNTSSSFGKDGGTVSHNATSFRNTRLYYTNGGATGSISVEGVDIPILEKSWVNIIRYHCAGFKDRVACIEDETSGQTHWVCQPSVYYAVWLGLCGAPRKHLCVNEFDMMIAMSLLCSNHRTAAARMLRNPQSVVASDELVRAISELSAMVDLHLFRNRQALQVWQSSRAVLPAAQTGPATSASQAPIHRSPLFYVGRVVGWIWRGPKRLLSRSSSTDHSK